MVMWLNDEGLWQSTFEMTQPKHYPATTRQVLNKILKADLSKTLQLDS